MSRQRRISAKSGGHEFTVQDHETDSPIVPIAQLEQLHQFRPDRVDWIFEQTELEAKSRRAEDQRINTFVFVERLFGTVCAFILGCGGLLGSIWLAHDGHEFAAASIGGVTLVSLVSAFIMSGIRR